MQTMLRVVTIFVVLVGFAGDARADGWISPFVGTTFGGDAGGRFENVLDEPKHLTWGFDVGWMGSGIFGAEFDYGYTNDFFGTGTNVSENRVQTALPTLILGAPLGGQSGFSVRPFGTVGIGWVKRELTVDNEAVYDGESDWAYTFGGGVMMFFADHFGIRGDYKFIRAFSKDDLEEIIDEGFEEGTFNFSRGSLGLIFRF